MAQKMSITSAKPLRYLEIGAGSGALTRPIVERLRKQDYIDIVESDPTFCTSLRHQFAHLSNVYVHETSILNFEGKNYDVVISSLPLNAFHADLVCAILKKYKDLIKPGGYLSYYEYPGLEKLKSLFLFGKSASDFDDVQLLKRDFAKKYAKEAETIWWNFPPARIVLCKMNNDINHE